MTADTRPGDTAAPDDAAARDGESVAEATGAADVTEAAAVTDPTDHTEAADVTDRVGDDPAWDVHALPGGAASVLEAVLLVADEPIPAVRLATVLALPTAEVEALLGDLADEYRGARGARPRGFDLRRVGGGWRLYTAPAYADVVGRFVTDGQSARLTQAALETLAIVAYRQPVTRGQIAAVRGVNVDGVVRTLAARGLVAEIGTDPGSGAVLYGTTGYFLERMGLGSVDELPPLAPYLPDMDSFDGVDDAAEDHQ